VALEELAADDALFARAQPRDFLNVHTLVDVYGLPRMCALAAERDPGFKRSRLAEALATIDRYDIADFDLDEAAFGQLRSAGCGPSRPLAADLARDGTPAEMPSGSGRRRSSNTRRRPPHSTRSAPISTPRRDHRLSLRWGARYAI
jgi:hypothetical protein